jgi:hypothetical protein
MLKRSNLILILGVLLVLAPELEKLGSASSVLEWGNLWHLVGVAAGALLVRLSGQEREKEKNGPKEEG